MGFERDINAILEFLPASRQTFLFSATVSQAIQRTAQASLKESALFLDCVPEGEAQTVAKIDQYAQMLSSPKQLLPQLVRTIAHDQITNSGKSKIIVFLPTTKMTQLFATIIKNLSAHTPGRSATRVYEIHSKLEQRQRVRVSDHFRGDKSGLSILVTSDVSARGVDYPGTTRVIQVGATDDGEQYTHRVGRTGRGGSTGRGDILIQPFEAPFVQKQLHSFPVQQISENDFMDQINDALAKSTLSAQQQADIREGLDTIEDGVARLQGKLDEEVCSDVIGSQLGWFAKARQASGIAVPDIIDGMMNFGTGALGMERAPHFGSSFLAKIGLSTGRGGGGGGGASRWRLSAGLPFFLTLTSRPARPSRASPQASLVTAAAATARPAAAAAGTVVAVEATREVAADTRAEAATRAAAATRPEVATRAVAEVTRAAVAAMEATLAEAVRTIFPVMIHPMV
jgi:ATP-dependent RNA helicase MSS116